MNALRHVIWWAAFLMAGIALQSAVPGLDAFSVGLIILLEDRDYRNLAWLLPTFIILQEGMGTALFGSSVVWYTALVLLYKLGRWLFEVNNLFFVLLLSTWFGAAYFGVAWLMAPLQDVPAFDMRATLDKSLIQALYVPVAWWLLAALRRWILPREE
ncbi:hypothetical protein [uncultured Desulfovibrio sp.]|uniref:Uncharacterized protein n=1 Tax=Candidatus Desulfovibrio intestinavium TaxID=2838534 RepID=A0A9D2KRH3_9BACT|nr:hypothetical protein [uncultured Desulfovibrio sp.]HJA79589.1 hypothetical protein [Candidatus Desulfovibrio intestinavium]